MFSESLSSQSILLLSSSAFPPSLSLSLEKTSLAFCCVRLFMCLVERRVLADVEMTFCMLCGTYSSSSDSLLLAMSFRACLFEVFLTVLDRVFLVTGISEVDCD